VVVLDAAEVPRWKACGEGLLPQGVAVLERLGVSIPEAIPLRGIRFRVGGTAAWMPFPRGRGLATSRYSLDEAIRARASALGAEFVQARATKVETGRVITDRGKFRARVVIGADGVRSTVRRSLGIAASYRRDRVGFSTHWEGALREPGVVEVTAFPGGEVYVAPLDAAPSGARSSGSGNAGETLEPGRALTALLVDRNLHVTRGTMEAFIRERLASRFGSARREGPVLGAFPLGARVDCESGPGCLLVGDAAGMVDPISGEGMSLALQGAELAARAVGDYLGAAPGNGAQRSQDAFRSYATRLRRLRRPIERVTAAMLFLSRHRGVAQVALSRDERLAPLMRVATGEPGLLTRIAGL
jgi:flavin-dependent dehydrogenase